VTDALTIAAITILGCTPPTLAYLLAHLALKDHR
jgi:hypothetical protein